MAIYHLRVATGTRSGGQSALAKFSYICRAGKYRRGSDEVIYVQSGNMPSWALEDPRRYWDAADLYERANGRLFKEIEFALPLELSDDQQKVLVSDFAKYLTMEGLPYTLAIHKKGQNPHCHLMISERINDGVERPPTRWFRRWNSKQPEAGGAKKSEALKPKFWLEETRKTWADFANRAIEQAGYDARIDHRSLKDQGIDRLPTRHLGPGAVGYELRTGKKSRRRLDIERENTRRSALQDKLGKIAKSIARLEELLVNLKIERLRLRLESQDQDVEDNVPKVEPRGPALC